VKEKFFLPHFVLTFEKKENAPFELKVIVTKKMKRAVDRNRVKRVAREFFRQKRGLLPGNLVVCRVSPAAAETKNAELFQELSKIL
jgi:ribonuclease P protein component